MNSNMILFLVFLPFVLLGCSSSTAQPPYQPQPSPPQPTTMILFKQPAIVPAYSNMSPPKDTMGVTLWGPFEKLPSMPTNASSGNGVLDIVIDNASIPRDVQNRGGMGTIVLGYSFKVPVQGSLFMSNYRLRVPRANGIAQVVNYYNFHDKVNKTSVWIGQIVFDTRCDKQGDALWDSGTATPIYNVRYSNFTCSTFNDWRTMSFSVGGYEIAAAASALKNYAKLSPNIGDYELMHVNINPEAVGANARIDVGIQSWQVSK